jgi:demethylmenaquinone methyltransferase/2-methoxy-6-polyprenyl-1,4-benzoquinol methylase
MPLLNLESVPQPDAEYIRAMFDRMAGRYDAFTFWMSAGQAKHMRAAALRDLRPGERVLDVACGTGDLALEAARRTGDAGRVVGLDFSPAMLEVAERRRVRRPAECPARVEWVCQGAETLPLAGEPFDWVVSGFALRGLYEHIDAILTGIRTSLAPGGRIALLDLTEPPNPFFRRLYKVFFFSYVALLGTILFGRRYPVGYLPESSARFTRAAEFIEKLRSHGFGEVKAETFIFGSVTLYRATRD